MIQLVSNKSHLFCWWLKMYINQDSRPIIAQKTTSSSLLQCILALLSRSLQSLPWLLPFQLPSEEQELLFKLNQKRNFASMFHQSMAVKLECTKTIPLQLVQIQAWLLDPSYSRLDLSKALITSPQAHTVKSQAVSIVPSMVSRHPMAVVKWTTWICLMVHAMASSTLSILLSLMLSSTVSDAAKTQGIAILESHNTAARRLFPVITVKWLPFLACRVQLQYCCITQSLYFSLYFLRTHHGFVNFATMYSINIFQYLTNGECLKYANYSRAGRGCDKYYDYW